MVQVKLDDSENGGDHGNPILTLQRRASTHSLSIDW